MLTSWETQGIGFLLLPFHHPMLRKIVFDLLKYQIVLFKMRYLCGASPYLVSARKSPLAVSQTLSLPYTLHVLSAGAFLCWWCPLTATGDLCQVPLLLLETFLDLHREGNFVILHVSSLICLHICFVCHTEFLEGGLLHFLCFVSLSLEQCLI